MTTMETSYNPMTLHHASSALEMSLLMQELTKALATAMRSAQPEVHNGYM